MFAYIYIYKYTNTNTSLVHSIYFKSFTLLELNNQNIQLKYFVKQININETYLKTEEN